MAIHKVPEADLQRLRKYDTPTICNVVELFDRRSRTAGYMDARIKAAFPSRTPAKTGTPALPPWRSTRRISTAFTTWPATCGSGRATGIDRSTTPRSPPRALRAIRAARTHHSIRQNRVKRSGCIEAARFCAPISTAPATSSAREEKASRAPAPTILVFDW